MPEPKRTTPQPPVEKLLYDVKSAAYALSLSTRTIKKMIATKQLPYRRYGKKNLIPAADIRRIAKLEQLQEG
jgi:excisionase family DNA binding protein